MRPSTLLRTKFIIPPTNPEYIPRLHLLDWMKKQADRRLILISAPPGYGKTTLLSSYITGSSHPVAWFQLDTGDSDPTVFLTHLVESLRRMTGVPAAFGQASHILLDSPDASLDPRRILTVLINELSERIKIPFLLVLEDYQFIVNPVVHLLMDFLIENAPAELHFAISTRADPPLSLARLRARGMLAELRAADLRFRDDEVGELITRDVPGLSGESLTLLNEKTEGWVAALQILRSSLSGLDAHSAEETIAGLNGSHRFVFDYLTEEVFRRLPESRQMFLLKSAILSQMDAPACSAITDSPDAQAILDELEGQNLFLASLDPQQALVPLPYPV